MRVERLVDCIVRRRESSGEVDVASQAIGEAVMEALKALDDVAYVRYASVYRGFREARDFEEILGSLAGEDGEESRPSRAEAG